GNIENDTITGSLQVLGFSDYGGFFKIKNHGGTLEALAKRRRSDSKFSRAPASRTYNGVATSKNFEGERPVQLYVTKPPVDQSTEIYYLLYPNSDQNMQVSFTIADGLAGASFPVALFDSVDGILQARQDITLNNSVVTLTLGCQDFYFAADR